MLARRRRIAKHTMERPSQQVSRLRTIRDCNGPNFRGIWRSSGAPGARFAGDLRGRISMSVPVRLRARTSLLASSGLVGAALVALFVIATTMPAAADGGAGGKNTGAGGTGGTSSAPGLGGTGGDGTTNDGDGDGGGGPGPSRTVTSLSELRILSPMRLPIPPRGPLNART
jgi:hypothetical protein